MTGTAQRGSEAWGLSTPAQSGALAAAASASPLESTKATSADLGPTPKQFQCLQDLHRVALPASAFPNASEVCPRGVGYNRRVSVPVPSRPRARRESERSDASPRFHPSNRPSSSPSLISGSRSPSPSIPTSNTGSCSGMTSARLTTPASWWHVRHGCLAALGVCVARVEKEHPNTALCLPNNHRC